MKILAVSSDFKNLAKQIRKYMDICMHIFAIVDMQDHKEPFEK